MSTNPSPRESRPVKIPRPAARVSGVAIRLTRLARFRSLQSTATIGVRRNIHVDGGLRPIGRSVLHQSRAKHDRAWRYDETCPSNKKSCANRAYPRADSTGFPGKSMEKRRSKVAENW